MEYKLNFGIFVACPFSAELSHSRM